MESKRGELKFLINEKSKKLSIPTLQPKRVVEVCL